jgi:hypothetical protein
VRSRGEVGEGPVTSTPAHCDERALVRAFTDMHRNEQFTAAARPVAPLRRKRRPAREAIDADAVEAPVVEPQVPRATRIPDSLMDAADSGLDTSVADGTGDVRRRGLAGTAERRLSDALALAGASGALIVPWPWLLAVAGSCLVVGAVRSVAAGRRSIAVGIMDVPGRAARRVARLARPRSLLRLPVITVRVVLAAVVLPAAAAATVWVVARGSSGVWAAARLAAWQSGLRVLAAVLCLMMLVGVGDARAWRAARLHRATASWPDAGVVALAAGALALALAVVAVGPRVSGGALTGTDGLAWAPSWLRPAVDRVRDDVVAAELRALASCLTDHQDMVWSADYTADNPVDALDVARLSTRGGDEPGSAALVTAALAADNQLAAWVEVVEIAVGDAVVLELDRRALDHHGVRVDPATLGRGVVSGADVAVTGGAGVDHGVALACSAGPVP